MKLTAVQDIYTGYAEDYDRELRDDMHYQAYAEVPQLVVDALDHKKRADILDLGCGTGLSSMLFFEQGWQVTGIEGTRAMIQRARKLPYKRLVQQDLESPWRVADHSFDAIVLVGVMEYIARPDALFGQASRKLRKGGLMGISVPYKNKFCSDAGLKSYYKQEIAPMLSEAGFRTECSRRTLGYEDAGRKVHYVNYLLRKR